MYYIIIKSETLNARQNRPANHWSVLDKNGYMALKDWKYIPEIERYIPEYSYAKYREHGYTWDTGFKTAEGALNAAIKEIHGYPDDVVYGITDANGAAKLLFNGGRE